MFSLAHQQKREGCVAEPGRAVEDGVEDRSVVGRRAADGAQDVAGRGLALERMAELVGAGLEGLEQAHVVDGDNGLVGEGREQRDLALVKGPHFATVDRDLADALAALHHRDEKRGPNAFEIRRGDPVRHTVAITLSVGNVGQLLWHAFERGP